MSKVKRLLEKMKNIILKNILLEQKFIHTFAALKLKTID
jgi:hypothetical protein